ncbi:competence/damage-inducible protein A [Adhaeribacter radiodurans]|uniref:CinA-like protein n=1 Tax=Adhaeribacter radiodurans TaxID=2745197 RepID=A0A7L7LBY0_9BACT|nr:competence/damage-inducible protein A [Adhaeribacter radiodurans]QMU30035.1 competence/damage-inducible protein A [Adhaeribacter radiodurans]
MHKSNQNPNIVLAEIITIGDEILYGQIVDTNSAFIGTELGKIGIKVKQITSVSDDATHIKKSFDDARSRANIILITGGLGPTKDDLTKSTLAQYFGVGLKLDEQSLLDVTEIFRRHGREVTELNRQQAFLPENCEPVRNVLGTAPGMWFEVDNKIMVSMPGVPFEMKRMMTDIVLPRLQQYFRLPKINHKVIMTIGIGESFLAEKIADWEDNLPKNIKLAYLPNLGSVRLRLTGLDTGIGDLEAQMQAEVDKLSNIIPEYIFAYGEVSLPQAIGNLLKKHYLTISTAESCTGGNIAHKLTTIPGSSAYYKGGIISYDNAVKVEQLGVSETTLETFGAVSEETVSEMAQNVRLLLKTDIGIATSGIAGPTGGTTEKPVGTIWIAYADAHQTVTKKLNFNRTRELNIEYTTMMALNLVRQSLPEAFRIG